MLTTTCLKKTGPRLKDRGPGGCCSGGYEKLLIKKLLVFSKNEILILFKAGIPVRIELFMVLVQVYVHKNGKKVTVYLYIRWQFSEFLIGHLAKLDRADAEGERTVHCLQTQKE
jgi:hypothetical protein